MKHLYEIRKALHKIPEPAFKEIKTTGFILNHLKKYDELRIHTFSFPGLLVEYSNGTGDYVLYRADMDALPIEEKTGIDFSSEHHGYMHACGHDMHMTILIGLIEQVILRKLKKNLLFLFQPAEEGFGGAERVIATGLLDKYEISEVYALHVHPSFPVGTIATNRGILFGIPQEFDVNFKGSSAHAANPEKGKDAIASACYFYQSLPHNIEETLIEKDHYICHIGKITGGVARNVIAEYCSLQGTLRAFTREDMMRLKRHTEIAVQKSADIYKTEGEVKYLSTYDPVVNSERLYSKLQRSLDGLYELVEVSPFLLGEDFGFFTSRYEGLMFLLGVNTPDYDLHSPYFLPDMKVIDVGVRTFMALLQADS